MHVCRKLGRGKPGLSFEFFPPKDDIGLWDLYATVESLKPLDPTYVSLTYGAGGRTRGKTVELVGRIQKHLGVEAVAHLTCVDADRLELARVLESLRARGIDNLIALRGDPPAGMKSFVPTKDGFSHASELVSFIRDRYSPDEVCVGAACYPETHPESPSAAEDMAFLKRKVDAGVDFLITQLFFDNDCYLSFRDRAVAAGIDVPIVAGIMPILSVRQVKRFTQVCGARIPKSLLRKIEPVEDDAEAVRHIGMYHATQQCLELLEHGAAGIHFYTLNRSTATRAIYQLIRAGLETAPDAGHPSWCEPARAVVDARP